MSVYSRTNAAGKKFWRYDFEFEGQRYVSADPHFKSEAKARGAEAKLRKQLKRGRLLARNSKNAPTRQTDGVGASITLAVAADRYWADVASRHRSASDIERRIAIVKRLIGPAKDCATISTATVIEAMGKRMKEETLRPSGKPSGKKVTGPGANRDIIDTLRPIINHAAAVFEDDGFEPRKINWKKAREAEAEEQVCEFSDSEIQRWGEALNAAAARFGRDGANERAFLTVALEYGPRLGELHFPPDAFRPDAPGGAELQLGRYVGKAGVERESRKDRTMHAIPLRDETVALLAPLVERARAEGAKTIWLDQKRDGALEPISYDAMRHRLHSAALKAGIAKTRIIHGMRHHAGTTIARDGGMLRVQQLLGHKQITTSRRYTHAKKDELRAALEEIQRKKSQQSPAQAPPSKKSASPGGVR